MQHLESYKRSAAFILLISMFSNMKATTFVPLKSSKKIKIP